MKSPNDKSQRDTTIRWIRREYIRCYLPQPVNTVMKVDLHIEHSGNVKEDVYTSAKEYMRVVLKEYISREHNIPGFRSSMRIDWRAKDDKGLFFITQAGYLEVVKVKIMRHVMKKLNARLQRDLEKDREQDEPLFPNISAMYVEYLLTRIIDFHLCRYID